MLLLWTDLQETDSDEEEEEEVAAAASEDAAYLADVSLKLVIMKCSLFPAATSVPLHLPLCSAFFIFLLFSN